MLPKILGADVELSNFIVGLKYGAAGTGPEAAKALLREIHGVSDRCVTNRLEDWGRRYLPSNGACSYIDLGHLEICLPETRSAHDFLASWQAMLRIARGALQAANAKLPEDQRLHVLVDNSDGQGHSYGSHLNILLSRETWDRLFHRKLQYLLYLASFHASSIVYAGQGKVGSENGAPPVRYQISQRADFIETISGSQTTFRRPLVNTRDEPLCRTGARLHTICYDSNLCHVATVLKAGVLQIVLAMLEADWVSYDLLLEDPIHALSGWSHDPTLESRAPVLAGSWLTAVEHQLLFLEEARRFVDQGNRELLIPRATEIVELWESTLLQLEAKDFASLASRLDWVAKLSIIESTLAEHPDLDWDSPGIKHLDQLYASLDPDEGLYWCAERQGLMEILATEPDIERFMYEPPEDTRAWTRAMLLRAGADAIEKVDWHFVRFGNADGSCSTVELDDPAGSTRLETEELFHRGLGLDGLLDAFGHGDDLPARLGREEAGGVSQRLLTEGRSHNGARIERAAYRPTGEPASGLRARSGGTVRRTAPASAVRNVTSGGGPKEELG